jgi:hypothetical protein
MFGAMPGIGRSPAKVTSSCSTIGPTFSEDHGSIIDHEVVLEVHIQLTTSGIGAKSQEVQNTRYRSERNRIPGGLNKSDARESSHGIEMLLFGLPFS